MVADVFALLLHFGDDWRMLQHDRIWFSEEPGDLL
jgi:hypothetical protein